MIGVLSLLVIVLLCTCIGALVGHPSAGLIAGVVIALAIAWAISSPY